MVNTFPTFKVVNYALIFEPKENVPIFQKIVVVYRNNRFGIFWSLVNFRLIITDEILSRTTPNFIDLMIAFIGGIAGGYSLVYKKLAVAIVGIAIAMALVPPLCSACILFIKGDYQLGKGALLLTFGRSYRNKSAG